MKNRASPEDYDNPMLLARAIQAKTLAMAHADPRAYPRAFDQAEADAEVLLADIDAEIRRA